MNKELAIRLGLGKNVQTLLPVEPLDTMRWAFLDWSPRAMLVSGVALSLTFIGVGIVGTLSFGLPWQFGLYCGGFAVFSFGLFYVLRTNDQRIAKIERQKILEENGYHDVQPDDVTLTGSNKKAYVLIERPLYWA